MLKVIMMGICVWASSSAYAMQYIPPQVDIPETGAKVVVNIPQSRVYLYQDGQEVGSWRSGPGTSKTPTPTGKWKIGEIKDNPTWFVPASIQAEYRSKGMKVKASVPPGPHNPLGPVFVRMGQTSIGIHGTNKPNSVPGFPSHGCIRMKSEEAVQLSEGLRVGDAAEITYEPVLVGVNDQGEVFLEVHKNVYNKPISYEVKPTLNKISSILSEYEGDFEVDEEVIETALRQKKGIPLKIGQQVVATTTP